MLKPLLYQLLGILISIYPLVFFLIPRLIKQGWKKVFSVKDRPLPPDTLLNAKWGSHNFINLPGVRMHYVEKGSHDLPLMVFLHGYPEFWYSWRYQLDYFAKDYWCIAPDLRGYGWSDKPSGVRNYSRKNLSDDIKNLIKALGREKCVLVGHDWGGVVGYELSTRNPEMVDKFIVINFTHLKGLFEQFSQGWEQILKSWYVYFYQCPVLPEMFMRLLDLVRFDLLFQDMGRPENKEAIEAYKFAFRDSKAFRCPINYYRALVQYPENPDPVLEGVKVRVPVLSIFGTGDKYLSVAASKRAREYCLDFQDEYLEGVSHWSMMEQPDKVNQIMEEFLQKRK